MSTKLFEDKGMNDVGPIHFAIFYITVIIFTFIFNITKLNFVWWVLLSTVPATIDYLLLYIAMNSEHN